MMKNYLSYVVLAGMLLFSSCNDEDEVITVPNGAPIGTYVAAKANLSTLESALVRTGLLNTLNESGASFTLYAPSDLAFESAGINLGSLSDAELEQILLYHVVLGDENTIQARSGVRETANGQVLTIVNNGQTLTLNGASQTIFEESNYRASNGYVHIIDSVLTPLNIVSFFTSLPSFSLSRIDPFDGPTFQITTTRIVDALTLADPNDDGTPGELLTTLAGPGPFTVFVPDDFAFFNFESFALGAPLENIFPDAVGLILLGHVVSGAKNINSVAATETTLTTQPNAYALGNTINTQIVNGELQIAQGSFGPATVKASFQVGNGFIHIIDDVLFY
ncbi:MAG: hypothetical protein OHK0053_12160 [Microscillaceae bacterium]